MEGLQKYQVSPPPRDTCQASELYFRFCELPVPKEGKRHISSSFFLLFDYIVLRETELSGEREGSFEQITLQYGSKLGGGSQAWASIILTLNSLGSFSSTLTHPLPAPPGQNNRVSV